MSNWRKFDGRYQKGFHLAKTPDGKIWPAWPNAGVLNASGAGTFKAGDDVEFRECSYEEYCQEMSDEATAPKETKAERNLTTTAGPYAAMLAAVGQALYPSRPVPTAKQVTDAAAYEEERISKAVVKRLRKRECNMKLYGGKRDE
jgi:hypothetical protein